MSRPAAYLVRGPDPVLVREEVSHLLHRLAGDDDPGLLVEEVAVDAETGAASLVEAARTPPFLADRRIVIARELQSLRADQIGSIVTYLADPLPTTVLVLAATGPVPPKLVAAVTRVGEVVDCGPTGRDASGWVRAQARAVGLTLDASAARLVAGHLGEDVGRLPEVLRALEAFSAPGVTLRAEDVAPFLGEAGGVPAWELTDAIDRGDTAAAIGLLHRMLDGGGRHPLAVHAVLVTHYGRMLRLEGAGVADEAGAAAALGLPPGRAGYPARKALEAARRLGTEGVARAIRLLHEADLDLKGRRDLPAALVMEVLVARLSRLAPRRAPVRRR